MKKTKLIDIKIAADDYNVISNHYSRMGFEMVDGQHYMGTKYHGSVYDDGFNIEQSNYDYYICTYKFDMSAKNAKERWKMFKKYKKLNKTEERLYSDKYGDFYVKGIPFLIIFIFLATLILLLFPLCFDNKIGDYYTLQDSFFGLGGHMAFSFGLFALGMFVSVVVGLSLAFAEQGIWFVCTRKKRKLNALAQIPIVRQSIEKLTIKAANLQAK